MNIALKVGFGVAALAATVFATGCAEHAPAFQCGRVDYKSCCSCKSCCPSGTMTTRRGRYYRDQH